jgi:hypothetical protein
MKIIKTALALVALVGVMYVTFEWRFNEVVTVTNEREEVAEEVLPQDWVQEAEQAKEAVIARKRLEKELAELEAIKASTTARMTVIEKELGTY